MVFHVINRGVGRQTIFHKQEDYAAFERVLDEAWHRLPSRILSYCRMPNHWHFVFWPQAGKTGQGSNTEVVGFDRLHRSG